MKVQIYGIPYALEPGLTAADCLQRAGTPRSAMLAARLDGELIPLDRVITRDCTLSPAGLDSEEGRRIYERAISQILLAALDQLYPGHRFRVEHSVGRGFYMRLMGLHMEEDDLAHLDAVMRGIIAADLPFKRLETTAGEAVRLLSAQGRAGLAALLSRRAPEDRVVLHGLNGLWECAYGLMVPSTGYTPVYALRLHRGDLILQVPDKTDPSVPARFVDRPHHLAAFAASVRWCEILGVENVADLALMEDEHQLRQFIRINEVLHEQSLSTLSATIVRENRHVVLIAGPSSSGKTTFAGRLCVHLNALGHAAHRMSLDDYFLNRDAYPVDDNGEKDYEHIECLDLPLIQDQVTRLVRGETVMTPRFDFITGQRAPEAVPMKLEEGGVLVIEGIHALNPRLYQGMPQEELYRVFVSALSCLNLDDHTRIRTTDNRLLRRMVRDYRTRGTSPLETISRWPSVRRGEERWIFPYQEMADYVFNTALHYELPVLAHFVSGLLSDIPADSEAGIVCARLKGILSYMPEIDERILSEIPPLSLVREFIGGGTMEEN